MGLNPLFAENIYENFCGEPVGQCRYPYDSLTVKWNLEQKRHSFFSTPFPS
jgi:hypothetical protein